MLSPSDENVPDDRTRAPSPLVRFVLWDYERGSLPYDIALVLALLALFLVPGGFWGDPLWVAVKPLLP